MAYILKRPMFRKGGLSQETGIMSGLDRRGYAGGGNIGGGRISGTPMGSRTGFLDPQSAFSKGWNRIWGSPTAGGQTAASMRWPWLSEKGLMEAGKKFASSGASRGAGIASGFAQRFPRFGVPAMPYLGPASALALKASMIKPTEEEKEYGMTGWRGDIEKALASSLPGGGMEYLPLGLRKAFGLKKKPEELDKIDPLDKADGEKELKGDMESDLMRAYKEYAPIFEKELGVSPEDTKKQLWMQLAKFGAGVAAQPGGDLVGAIGRAAEKPLEGAGEVVKDVSTAKRQAKLLALQTAIKEGEPGQIGKAINDIARVYKVSKAEAADIYEKWNARDATAKAKDTAAYRAYAEKKLMVNPEGFQRNIKKLLEGPNADLVGKFNKRLPMDDDVPDVDEIVDKEYYVGEDGSLYRADKSTEPMTLLEPGDDGFKDTKKKKK